MFKRTGTAARATNIDKDLPNLYRPMLMLPRPRRCVLHIIDVPPSSRLCAVEAYAAVGPAIERAREALGIPASLDSAWLDASAALEGTTVRGLKWRQMPVVGRPRYRLSDAPVPTNDPGSGPDVVGSIGPEVLGERVNRVVVHLPDGWDDPDAGIRGEALCRLARAVVLMEAFPQAQVSCVDGSGASPILPGEAAVIVRDVEPLLRFRWSYALNMALVVGKALDRAVAQFDEDAHGLLAAVRPVSPSGARETHARRVRAVASRAGFMREPDGLGHPLALQVLFAVRRAGRLSLRGPVDGTRGSWTRDLVCAADPLTPSWRGTGRHAPVPIPEATVRSIALSLVDHYLLRHDADGLALSRTGETFLDMIPPDFEDPDLPCRWRTLPRSPEDLAGMDDWIFRKFSKAKRMLSALATKEELAA